MNKSAFASTKNTELIAHRYQLKKLIGIGGMGEVFLATDMLLGGTPVAIKFLTQTVADAKIQKDFAREALMSAALSQRSLHIVRAYDYGVSEKGKPFYVMEYLNGKSLKELMPLPLARFLNLTRQICLGLQCAHEGIQIDGKICPLVHRDIKPANILVVPDPILGQLVKILDFGIAKFLNYTATLSTNKGFNGTLAYSSPEQLDGEKSDSRSDIYSLGVMMFEMLTGVKPWQPETDLFGAWYKAHNFEAPRTIAEVSPHLKIPQQINDLIMACLAKKASDRPQTIGEVLQILEAIEKYQYADVPVILTPKNIPKYKQESQFILPVETKIKEFTWPQNKPIQEIVFPQILNTNQGTAVALLLMLPETEIQKQLNSKLYNRFIFVTSPHPMLLWVTLLYSQTFEAKWLPCYLDMQNPYNRRLVSFLADHNSYPLICFTLEPPNKCTQVLTSHINLSQRQKLKIWVEQSQKLPPTTQPQLSKNLLKQQYKPLQSQMLERIGDR